MKVSDRRILVCSCEGTMPLDPRRLAQALAADEVPPLHRHLCRSEIGRFREALADDPPLLVCCTQEAPLFTRLAAEMERPKPDFVDIRDRAGWSDEAGRALPKIAALIAEALLPVPPAPTVTLSSGGAVLVYCRDEAGLEAAERLAAESRPVTCLVAPPAEKLLPPAVRNFTLLRGRVTRADGYLGAFGLSVDRPTTAAVSARGALMFDSPAEAAELAADVILDLSGASPLFREGSRRIGYLRADPAAPAAVERAIADARRLVGTFDKPRYVTVDPSLCAHSRHDKLGCTKCLDACPSSSIRAAGDHVAIDPYGCSGHGACAAVCPTGAIAYVMPAGAALSDRLPVLLAAYRRAGGTGPQLLVHDGRQGEALIRAVARHDRGLPAAVVPFAVNEVTALGLDFILTALAHGAARLLLLAGGPSGDDTETLTAAARQADEILAGLGYGKDRVVLLDQTDPLGLAKALRTPAPKPIEPAAAYQIPGRRREVFALALTHLHGHAPISVDVLPLAGPAPFGRIILDQAKCTVCLACVGACPTAALGTDQARPLLSFHEGSCVQCNLCRAVCPEDAIALERRLVFGAAWSDRQVLKEEDDFPCIVCGKPVGPRSTVERIVHRLTGHPMFREPGKIDLLKMCEHCRVVAQWGVDGRDGPKA